MSAAVAESLSLVLLVVVLAAAVFRPWGWPEAVIAVPAAVIVIGTGAVSLGDATSEVRSLGPVERLHHLQGGDHAFVHLGQTYVTRHAALIDTSK